MTDTDMQDSVDAIAIIGMSGRFPGADSVEQFWENLRAGVESITFFTDEALAAAGVDRAVLADEQYVKANAILNDIEHFDAAFFGLPPAVATITDPQHRLFLECAWEALESAGYDSQQYRGTIGVYAGASLNTYLLSHYATHRDVIEALGIGQAAIANRTDHLATHTCYRLDLQGPGVTVQSTCSTSLVAVHMACQSLLSYQCGMALAGGVTVRVPQIAGYQYQEGGIFSPDGHCRAFDEQGRGTVAGNGVGIVVLKRLEDALAEGDSIYAVIRASAINNDGAHKIGYTAPSVEGQARVIALAHRLAGITGDSISYVETHGTGTPLGDPIEIAALTRAFRATTNRHRFCAIGSAKTNVGHLDAAAGVTGLIKTALALKHRTIPPSLHFTRPNPNIDQESPFFVQTTAAEWKTHALPRRAGVSSFGIGGTNAHVVLEEAPAASPSGPSRPWQVLMLSARTKIALEQATDRLRQYMLQNQDARLADVAFTTQVGRRAFEYRRVVVCRELDDAVVALETLAPKRVASSTQEPRRRPIVFMFPGQGSQHAGMAAELYQTEPLFREYLDNCAELLRPHLGLDLRDVIYPEEQRTENQEPRTEARTKNQEPGTRNQEPGTEAGTESQESGTDSGTPVLGSRFSVLELDQTWLAQPALFVIEYALAQLWMSWGVRPESLIGHSIGEYVAACLSGVFTLEDALRLVALRGQLMQQMPRGAMLAVPLDEQALRPLLGGQLSLAAVNRPGLCVVAGPAGAVEQLAQRLAQEQVACRRLHTSHAFHSAMVEPIQQAFADALCGVTLQVPGIPFISNLTGTWITSEQATDPWYWAAHLRQTVQFSDGLQTLMQEPERILLEVGPGQALMTIARLHPARSIHHMVLASLPRADDADSPVAALLMALGRLWLVGARVHWDAFYQQERRRRLALPTYPFERKRYWLEERRAGAPAGDPLHPRPDIADWFYVPSWKRSVVPAYSNPAEQRANDRSVVVLLTDRSWFAQQLAQQFERQGYAVVIVARGAGYAWIEDRHYLIEAQQPTDYTLLLDDLHARELSPQHILHLWNCESPDPAGQPGLDQHLADSFYSLLALAQAFGQRPERQPVRLTILSSGMQEVIGGDLVAPLKALLLGPCRVIPQEDPRMTCRSIDVLLPPPGSAPAALLAEQIIAEVTSEATEPVVAYRSAHRWVQTFESVRLAASEDTPVALREGGVYMITGGLGGIGLALADYLARQVRPKLALVGRSSFPQRDAWEQWQEQRGPHDPVSKTICRLQALETAGAEVLVVSADVTDESAMRLAVAQAQRRFGAIHGVVHAAGVPGGGVIQRKTPGSAAEILAPKLQGTLVLDRIFQEQALDFIALCSSRTAQLGGFGQADYCAANAFLDAFARQRATANGPRVVAINWCAWKDAGMFAQAARPELATEGPAGPWKPIHHPLLKRAYVDSPERMVFTTTFDATDWVLADHRILGVPVIPGTTYLEMVRAAFAEIAGDQAVEIRDIFFMNPLALQDQEQREAHLVIEQGQGEYEFYVQSRSLTGTAGAWQRHVMGKLGIAPMRHSRHDLAAIRRRCTAKKIVLNDMDARDEDHGPRWQNIRQVLVGDNELLATQELAAQFAGDVRTVKLHPALLDKAIGTGREFLIDASQYMPFSYRRVTIYRPLPPRFHTHSRYRPDPHQAETQTFDLVLIDDDGNELVEIEAFKLKQVHSIGARLKSLAAAGNWTGADAAESPGSAPEGPVPPVQRAIYDAILTDDGITSAEGVDVFARVLQRPGLPQVIVSRRDLHAVMAHTDAFIRERILGADVAPAGQDRPQHARPELSTDYVAPETPIEQTIAAVWQSVLGIDHVGIHDNFFEIGGDSLIAIQVVSRLERELNVTIPPAAVFEGATIAALARLLSREEPEKPAYEERQSRGEERRNRMLERRKRR